MELIEIIKHNRSFKQRTSLKPIKFGILANVTLQLIKPILEYYFSLKNINAVVYNLGFNNFIEESKDSNYDFYFIFWETINLTENIKGDYFNYSLSQKQELFNKIKTEIKLTLRNLSNVKAIIFNTFSEYSFTIDPIHKDDNFNIARQLNDFLYKQKKLNVTTYNFDALILKCGIENSFDYSQYYLSSSLYKSKLIEEYVKSIIPFILNKLGAQKKMIVLDADNTLWKGIIGEDGIKGINCNVDNIKGKIYNEAQLLFKYLKNKGVLLALCSKNNIDEIRNVFKNKDEMILKSDDFVNKKVNWYPKNENIRKIAKEVNIGLDSIVFIDDSDFEIELVKKTLPEVVTIKVPNNISEYPSRIKELFILFNISTITNEDTKKTQLYLEENKRRNASEKFDSIDNYINSLGLKLAVSKNDKIPLERCVQLTQKTNQFNFTTKRYTELQIKNIIKSINWEIYSMKLSDKFGNYGTTGLIIIKTENKKAIIKNFLMSCRVLGRKVEEKLFQFLIEDLKSKGINHIYADYKQSNKNQQVSDFYNKMGMNHIKNESNPEIKKYELPIEKFSFKNNLKIKIYESD
ncbi:MAG: HAD-IIIC family phosphatase [Flavobacteriaceae bacterium]